MDFISILLHVYGAPHLSPCCFIPHQLANIVAIKRQTIQIFNDDDCTCDFVCTSFYFLLSFFTLLLLLLISCLEYSHYASRSVACIEKTKSGFNFCSIVMNTCSQNTWTHTLVSSHIKTMAQIVS